MFTYFHILFSCSYDAVNIDNVKANFYTFGHSLKKSGHVSPSVMAVFYRVMFQNNHPSKSKKNYIFPSNGISILNFFSLVLMLIFICIQSILNLLFF